MNTPHDAAWFAERLGDRSAAGIALGLRALVRAGELPVGTPLPPVRALAFALGVSPATVSAAWSELRRLRILSGRGRNGAWVSGEREIAAPKRYASIGNYGAGVLDLSLAMPDPELMPPLGAALAHAAAAEGLNSYARQAILPELAAVLAPGWPYAAPGFLATDGGYSAVYALLHALSLQGARVAIEDPSAMRHLDSLEELGARAVPVACDAEGPRPEALRAALAQGVQAFVLQPRLHSVTGRTVSPRRLGQLAEVLAGHDTVVIEDDGLGALSGAAPQSLGAWYPERVAHVLSFSKTLGPDLRLAVLSAPEGLLAQVQGVRAFGSGWTSRLLQAAAAHLLRDPATVACVAHARAVYDARRAALVAAVRAGGGVIEDGHGLSAWLPVASESYALVTLAARGIAAAPGSRFTGLGGQFLRVSGNLAAQDLPRVAEALCLAARAP